MSPRLVREKHKKPGVWYAFTSDGLELPIADLTHPAFEARIGPAELAAMVPPAIERLRKSARLPALVRWILTRRSIVARGLMQASGGCLGGIPTYLQKLGPENLGGGYAGALDRRMVSAIVPLCARLRLNAVATLQGRTASADRQGSQPHAAEVEERGVGASAGRTGRVHRRSRGRADADVRRLPAPQGRNAVKGPRVPAPGSRRCRARIEGREPSARSVGGSSIPSR